MKKIGFKSTQQAAFTLAEVLITLGIIGVVAAMTIPTLLSNTNSQKFKSQYKKTLSTLNQAVRMSQAQYDANFSDTNGFASSNDNISEKVTVTSILNSSLTGYTWLGNSFNIKNNGTKIYNYNDILLGTDAKTSCSTTSWISVQLADGSIFSIHQYSYKCTKDNYNGCAGFIDVNGTALPNKVVSCTNSSLNGDSKTPNDCVVDNTSMGDIFPVYLYDSTVIPASNAAQYVLNSSK